MSMEDMEEESGLPPLRWSWWDVAGLTFYTVGTMLDQLDNGLRMLSMRCGSMATYERIRKDERDAEWAQERERQIMAKALDDGKIDWKPEDLT